jgi:hypothetical protein
MRFPACRALAAAFLLGACAGALAQDAPTTWNGFTAAALTFAEGDSKGTTWSGVFDEERRDFLLDVQLREPEPMRGRVGLVGGRVMIVRGLKLQPGNEIDAMDGPILSMRLALTVLGRLYPAGPGAVVGLQNVNHHDDVGMRFATPSASGAIPAPWSATGRIENRNAGVVNFDLTLTVPAQTPAAKSATGALHLKGRLATRTAPVFREDMPLEGWAIYSLGPVRRPGGTGFGARPETNADAKTIAELRRAAAEMRSR